MRKSYQITELARLAGVTVRTLHHYDRIGLLCASARTEAGYRVYQDADLLRLQQILVHRHQGMSLEQIREILDHPEVADQRELLQRQRGELMRRAEEVAGMLRSIDAALRALEEGEIVNAREIFVGFDHEQYREEVEGRWGQTEAFRECQRRMAGYQQADRQAMEAEGQAIMEGLAKLLERGDSATSEEARALADSHRQHLDRWFYPCSQEMHARLAAMYRADPRFQATFEAVREGLTGFLCEAIEANREQA